MADRVFVIQQIGAKDSPERKRADEIYNFIVVPAVKEAGLEPYRADLDLTPGAITPKMLSELLSARVVIADLTGHNSNVFYELGITHSFARPLISIADSSRSLPFDARDERIIELGEYPSSGLTYVQGERAQASLKESLDIVLGDGYLPSSPLREAAANRSVDELAPEDPIAAELGQMRETLEEIRKKVTSRTTTSPVTQATINSLREVIERNVGYLDDEDFEILSDEDLSRAQTVWAGKLQRTGRRTQARKPVEDPWGEDAEKAKKPVEDPWAADSGSFGDGRASDEPPF